MPVEMIENPKCDVCYEEATHVNIGFTGVFLDVEKGWSCDRHAIDIDFKRIEEVFDEQ
jgi:hypothetical protein